MKPIVWVYIGAILFAAIIHDEIVSWVVLLAATAPLTPKLLEIGYRIHNPGKYSEYSDK